MMKGETAMSELYLGIDIEKDRLHAALTENAETVVTVTEPLDGSSFGRFCERAVSMISELAQEYRPKSIGLTGDPKGIVYIDSNGNAVSEPMLSPKKEDDYISRIEKECGITLRRGSGLLTHYINTDIGTVPESAQSFSTLASYIVKTLADRNRPYLHTSEAFELGFYDFSAKDFDSRSIVKCRLADLRYPEVTDSPSVAGYLGNTPIAVALGRTQSHFLGTADIGGALVLLRKDANISYSVAKNEKQASATVKMPLFGGIELCERTDRDAKTAYDALLSLFARISVSVGGTEDVERTVNELALAALNETSLPKVRFDQGKLKISSESDGFTPDRIGSAFVKEAAKRLCTVSKTPTRLMLAGNGKFDSEAFRRSLAHVFGVDATPCDMTLAAAAGAARFASELG